MRIRRRGHEPAYLGLKAPVVLAHRGFDLHGRENTLLAFRQAAELGVQVVETDVHLSLDGVVVAFHDDDLDRVTTGAGKIAHHTWRELSEVTVAGEPLCRLEELFEALPDMRFNIDLKSDDVVEPFVKVLLAADARHPGLVQRVCVASFTDARSRRARSLLPKGLTHSAGLRRTALLWLGSRARPLRVLARIAARGTDVVQVPLKRYRLRVVDHRFIRAAHHYRIPVHVWTINDAEVMQKLLRLGVDGIVTDRSDIALRTVAGPGSDVTV